MAGQGWRPTERSGAGEGCWEPILPPRLRCRCVEPSARPRLSEASLVGRVLKARLEPGRRTQKIWGRADTEAGKQQEPVSTLGVLDDRAACTPCKVRPRSP